jgi:acyl-CoA dehydrogenase family protein 9
MSFARTVKPGAAARSLFFGRVDDESFHPYPKQDPEEQEACDLAVQAFREWADDKLDPEEIDRIQEIPDDLRRGMGELGMLGLTVPEEYGGAGLGYTSYCRFVEEVTRVDASLSVFLGAHLSIGARPILLFGNEEQKQRYLPGVASGETIAAFALTEPGAGSDAGALRTRARWDAEHGVYRLDGNKIWITNGGYAEVFTVFARTEGGPDAEGERGVSGFILERGERGFTNGPSEHKLGIRGTSTTELAFQDVAVAPESIVGPVGEGFKIALETLATGRLSLGAGCTGAAKGLVKAAAEHSLERKQFKKPISAFGMIREKLARMTAHAYGAESAVYLTTGLYDATDIDLMIETGYCKVLGSEVLWDVVNDTIQTVGGIGYMADYPYQRHLRDSRINLIFEGTNEILRLSGTLEGLKDPGGKVNQLLRAAKEKSGDESAEAVLGADEGFGPGESLRFVAEALRPEAEILRSTLDLFGSTVKMQLKKHRRRILAQQYTIRRLADGAIQLYAAAAALSRASSRIADVGEERAAHDILLARRFVEEACRSVRIQTETIDTPRDGLDDLIVAALEAERRYPAPLFRG